MGQANLVPSDIATTTATGYGVDTVYFASQKTSDIVCSARGTNDMFPRARAVIDIGSQSTSGIRLNQEGLVINFAFSEKCAAGSGRFIEVIANALRIDVNDFSLLAASRRLPSHLA